MPPLIKSCTTRSAKAGLLFPVGRAERHLRAVTDAPRVGVGAPVYLAGVLEYLAAELVEISGNVARDDHKAQRRSARVDREHRVRTAHLYWRFQSGTWLVLDSHSIRPELA